MASHVLETFVALGKLISKSEINAVGYGSKILKIFDAILHDCLQYPSAVAKNFGFLTKDLQIAQLPRSKIQISSEKLTSPTSSKSDFGLNNEIQRQGTKNERIILDIVIKLSGQDAKTVSRQTTFFRLGLDSISAVQMAAYLRRNGYNVSSFEVLEVSSQLFQVRACFI